MIMYFIMLARFVFTLRIILWRCFHFVNKCLSKFCIESVSLIAFGISKMASTYWTGILSHSRATFSQDLLCSVHAGVLIRSTLRIRRGSKVNVAFPFIDEVNPLTSSQIICLWWGHSTSKQSPHGPRSLWWDHSLECWEAKGVRKYRSTWVLGFYFLR